MARSSSHEVRDRFSGIALDLLSAGKASLEVVQGMRTDGKVDGARKNAFIDAVEKVEAALAAIRLYDPWYLRRYEPTPRAVAVDPVPATPVEAPTPPPAPHGPAGSVRGMMRAGRRRRRLQR
jgi:hypothetical protein